MYRILDSNKGIRTDTTSIGAQSISSNSNQRPSFTARVNIPGLQTNSPGISEQQYEPINALNMEYKKQDTKNEIQLNTSFA